MLALDDGCGRPPSARLHHFSHAGPGSTISHRHAFMIIALNQMNMRIHPESGV
jgi:hypothetical protein